MRILKVCGLCMLVLISGLMGGIISAHIIKTNLNLEETQNKTVTTYNFETKEHGKVYSENTSADKYDIYLSGATPLITIENPNAHTKKELLLFRDSFGSSIAPLLIDVILIC